MDGRGRQGTNNSGGGPPSAASVMSSYYGGSNPHTPSGDSGNGSYSPRDCFWTQSGSAVGPTTPADPWGTNTYSQQILPPPPSQQDRMTPNYSPASHHNNSPPNNSAGSFNINIPSHSPYPQQRLPPGNGSGMNMNGNGNNNGDLSPFSGPSPPNPIQAIPYGVPPPNSPRSGRQYTPSTTPSPHVISQQHQQQQSPNNMNGMNGNSSSHSSHESSPPNSGNNNSFDYINGGVEMNNSSGKSNNRPIEQHPNEVPGYLPPPPRQSLHNSSRYPGEVKASDGENMMQQHQQYQHPQIPYYHHHQNYASQYGDQNMGGSSAYYDSFNQNQRRPFDPYQPYPNTNQAGYGGEAGGYGSTEEYNQITRPNSNQDSGPRRRDSISGVELALENGTKINSCESFHVKSEPGSQEQGARTSYDDDANFEAVLHSHMNSYGGVGGGGHDQYRMMPEHHQDSNNFQHQPPPPQQQSSYLTPSENPPLSMENPQTKLSPNSKCDEVKPVPVKKREKKKKNRASSAVHNNNGSSNDDVPKTGPLSKGTKEKSFLAIGHPQSPLNSNSNSSQSSSSNQSRTQVQNPVKIEGGNNETSLPFSEGGEKSPSNADNPNSNSFESSKLNLTTAATTSSSESTTSSGHAPAKTASQSSSGSTSKKKPWKKAKQVNSEQLLEERERNCAQYIENSVRMRERAEGSSSSKVKAVKEEPICFSNELMMIREEKNITIDHQKEDQAQMYKVEHGGGFDKDHENSNSLAVVENDEDAPAAAAASKPEVKKDVPLVECGCFPIDEVHPEPGPFYTHLGAAHTLPELRELLEMRTGFRGGQLRFEKVIYTGKEGKTSQGCPLAKWILRRGTYEEQLLFLVKHRKGHKCATAWIVVCCVIWEAVPPHFADNLYDTIVYKLNRFGVPTTRRSDTNEQRSCACQGVDPDTCGAAYSFGCAWSMFFNGCKYARSRNVRKFRLTEEHEEAELEEKIQHLATHLAPLYERVASDSYRNQIEHENEGLECRLGYRPGRPFSGVTACVDYCSHAHKDAHNMINGCTVTVAFTRNRTLAKGDDEQFHVLPLYKLDETDEFGSKDGQKQKVRKGQLEILKKFQSKVRIRKVPLLPSRRRGKPKPPSSSSHSSHHHHPPPPKPSDLYSSDLSSLSMPPPIKREKMSIFDELNGPSGGSDLFDSRFPHGPTPPSHFSNLLLSKSHSKLGMGMGLPMSLEDHVQSHQISSTVLDSEGNSIWNTPYGQHQLQQSGHSHGQPGGSFRTYFDTPIAPPSQYSSKPAPQFGHNFDFNLNSSPRSGGNNSTTNNNSGSNSNSSSLMSPNLNPNNGPPNMQNSSNSSMTTPGYTSMSPSILPSFRHAFMTEAESLSMLSSMSSPSAGTGSPIADSTSSPRSGKPSSGPQLNMSSTSSASNHTTTPTTPFSHHNDSLGLNSTPSYFNSTNPIVPPNPYSNSANSSLYHPHPHHPTPSSCLSSAPNQVGVPFNSSTSYANSSSSFAPPPASMDPHHHAFGMGMNMNPISSWNPNMNMNMNTPSYSHHGYGPVPPPVPTASSYHHPHNQMSSLGMNSMAQSAFPHMNQYNPYGNQSNFMSPHAAAAAAMHSHHHPTNPWVSPLPAFMSGPHGHPPPPAPSCFVAPPKPKIIPEVNESLSDNEDAFKDSHLGGVGIALTHGSVILQCAKHEMHATTSLKSPNRMYPSRICLVFYQHKSMNNRFHGWSEWEKKIEAKKLQEVKLINQGKLEASPRKMKQLIKEGYLADTP